MPLFLSAAAYRNLLDRLHRLETERELRQAEHERQLLDTTRILNKLRMAVQRAEQKAQQPLGSTNGDHGLTESDYKFGRR
jgi:hypothetical protein